MSQLIAATAKIVGGYVFAATGSATLGALASSAVVGAAYVGVQVGLNSIAQAQLPDAQAGHISRKEPRPYRTAAMGLPSRLTPAWGFGE